ncbi:M1 family peptidase [Flavobacteriaceae bacterium R38]|nr:M1 family peptidase [Flavobacteriaceae bacterium R38]
MKQSFCFLFLFFTGFLYSQQTDFVDFKTGDAYVSIHPFSEEVSGKVRYTLEVKKSIDSVLLDAKNMSFTEIKLNDNIIPFKNDKKQLSIKHHFLANKTYTIDIIYRVSPKKTMYFIGWEYPDPEVKKQVWTQGQGKDTSHWLPSFDDMNEKVTFDLHIRFPDGYSVIANGKLTGVENELDHKIWHYDMKEPMSSYLLAIAAGEYDKKTIFSDSNIPIELYYYPEDSLKTEPTYRYTKKIFDFLEKEIDVPYPWQNYKQVPVKDFLYAGMENTTTTIFSDAYVVDSISFIDKNYVNVNAHELAHQWFGDLVTEENGTHHWLQEGFATYYALLAEKEMFGDDYFYWKLYQTSQQLIALSKSGKGESLLDPKASSLTFYEKGAWALFMLRNKIGDEYFQEAVKAYLNTYKFKNVRTNHFIDVVEQVSGQNLDEFVEVWLQNKEFPEKEALEKLKSSALIKNIIAVKNNTTKISNLKSIFSDENIYHPLKTAVLQQSKNKSKEVTNEYYALAFKDQDIKTRQEISILIDTIPNVLKKEFETLLEDKSYVTVENALFKLWLNFPQDRTRYLDNTKKLYGFNDLNLRLLWLTLVLATPEYDSNNTPVYYNELSGYTSPKYHFEIRQNAFRFLYQLQAFTNQNLKDILEACQHPVWQFSKSSRQLLDTLLKESIYRKRYDQFFSELSEADQIFFKKHLSK